MKFLASTGNRQGGAVAIIVALSLLVLVGMIGLVLDLGHLYIVKTELQNAADACALSAAREITGDANSLTRAENAGILVGGSNNVDFQGTPVAIEAGDITFGETLGGSYFPSASVASIANIKYVKCTLQLGGIRPWFMVAMGAGQQVVSAMAVATLAPSQTTCAIPVGLCAKTLTPPNYGFTKGEWLDKGIYDPGTGGTGSYNWVDFNPGEPTEGCGPSQGANELKCLLAEKPQCNIPTVGAQVGQQGYDQSLAAAYNTRFGLYKGSYNVNNNPPDYSGFAYQQAPNLVTWPNVSPQNAYLGVPSSGSTPNYAGANGTHDQHLPYQFNPNDKNGGGYLGGGYSGISVAQHASGTNRRVTISPVVDCNDLAASNPQSVPVKAYACVFLLRPVNAASEVSVEFLAMANEEGNPCATSGLAGGTIGPLVPVLVQ